jgi:hypothetical protein
MEKHRRESPRAKQEKTMVRENMLEVLTARVQTLEDAEAIRRLKARYAELVDSRYAKGAPKPADEIAPIAAEIASLFTDRSVWDGGALGVCSGRDAIRERMAAPTLHFSRHYFVNPDIRIDGDCARGRWELLAPCTSRENQPMWMAGAEEDEYERVGGVWLHARMQLSVHFFAPHERGWAKR